LWKIRFWAFSDLREIPHHLQFEDWISFPVARVFGFFSNPNNLPRIMPASTETKVDQLHLAASPPSPESHDFSKAAAERGPFKRWHHRGGSFHCNPGDCFSCIPAILLISCRGVGFL
jgi:hypothetical protein